MNAKKKYPVPTILLVGAGRFGKNHLRVLKRLDQLGMCTLAGVVVRSREDRERVRAEFAVPVFDTLSASLLETVDAVDIVTPIETHYALARTCLPAAHVFTEKPLATTRQEAALLATMAAEHHRVLMVGHIFRFHPLTEALKAEFGAGPLPIAVQGIFVNPSATDAGTNVTLDFLHFFDVMDVLLGKKAHAVHDAPMGRVHLVSIRYVGGIDAIFTLGWVGNEKKRLLTCTFPNRTIRADYLQNTLTIRNEHTEEKREITMPVEPLQKELETFLSLIGERMHTAGTFVRSVDYPDATVGARILDVALRAQPPAADALPRIAVIGAGVFGINCALKAAAHGAVTLFERNGDVMGEASYVNQYRHHWGYHYPRSEETVRDIQMAKESFEALYDSVIIRNFPTYYGVAKEGSKVAGDAYRRFCVAHALPFLEECPDPAYLNMEKISTCLKTWEPIYDYRSFKALVKTLVARAQNLTVRLGCTVTGGALLPDGAKRLTIQQNGTVSEELFDFVINATYANHNAFPDWLHFQKKAVRIDLVEALIIRLPIPRISLAVMDGPFTNLVPTGEDNIFTLVHIQESVLKRFVPANGLIPPGLQVSSRAKRIIQKSAEWFPIVREAEYLESRYVFRCVNANREHDDARPSDITRHGFGCYSVLGGKILNCVTVAEDIAQEIGNVSP